MLRDAKDERVEAVSEVATAPPVVVSDDADTLRDRRAAITLFALNGLRREQQDWLEVEFGASSE